ncbi:MAG TPA: hypothetical protein H9666_12200 [Firmicutes bacterium]|nr:hypothetical protein [Bacillota bacterium]
MAKKRYAAMALAGLLLLAGGCGQSSEPEMRESVRFNEFIQGLYQPGEGQYKVLDQEMQDITEAFIEATKEEAAKENYLAIRQYAREEDVTIQRWEVEPGQVTMDTYQRVDLSAVEKRTGMSCCDVLYQWEVPYQWEDGTLTAGNGRKTHAGWDFFENDKQFWFKAESRCPTEVEGGTLLAAPVNQVEVLNGGVIGQVETVYRIPIG